MGDQGETTAQLMAELAAYRQRVSELESAIEASQSAVVKPQAGEMDYRELAESISDIFFAMDHELRYTYWNHASERLTGIPASEALGKSIHELFPQATSAVGIYETALKTKSTQHFLESSVVGGREAHFDITVYPGSHGISVLAKDVTAQKNFEAALKKTEREYSALIEGLPVGVYRNTPGPEGHSLMANSACLRVLGFASHEELANVRIADLYVDPKQREAYSEKLLAEGSVSGYEVRLRRKDGAIIWVAITARVVRDAQGEVEHFEGIIEDITARKRQESEFAALAAVAKAISQTLELQPLVEKILETALHAIPAAEKGSLALLTSDKQHLQVRAIQGYQDNSVLGLISPVSWGYTGRAIRERRALRVNDVQDDAALRADAAAASIGEVGKLRSAIVMPLEVYGQIIGVISLESSKNEISFEDEDLRLLGSLGGPVALAIENARLFDETRRRLIELETLHRASRRLLDAQLDPEEIYTAIHQAVEATMPCEAFIIILHSENETYDVTVYNFDQGGRWPAQRFPHGEGLTGRVLASGQTLVIGDLDETNEIQAIHFGAPEHVRSVLAVPLRYGERLIGMLSAQSYRPHVYSSQHRLLLETLAAQFASVIANTFLYQQAQSRLRELEVVSEISAAVRAAPNRGFILNTILDQLIAHLKVEGASLERLEADNSLYTEQARGIWASLTGTVLLPGEGLSAHVLKTGQPYLNNDAHLDPRLFRPDLFAGCHAIAAALLIVENHLTGLLWIASTHTLNGDDLRLLTSIANIAANALHRAALQEQMLAQARQMTQIVESVPEGVILINGEGQVLLANPVAEQILKRLSYAPHTGRITHLGGHPLVELLTSPPKGLWHEIRSTTNAFELIARPIVNGYRSEHWVLVIKDVTEERQIREQLQLQERLAAVGQLAAGIAHDFNNIMAVIVLYTHMALRASTLALKDRERLETVMQQANRATELIQQILDFGRQAVLERRSMNLTAFVKEQVKLLQRILPENISVLLEHQEGEHTISADPTRIQQLLTNLAINARDAMPEGGVLTITLNAITVTPGNSPILPELLTGDWIVLTVADTGTGIPPEILPRIFEPFFSTKEPGKGSGLGLAQVYGIVGQHEGRITVENLPERGAAFSIYLPAQTKAADEPERPDYSDQPLGNGETILVVEDNAILRTALAENLMLLNYDVLQASNGQEALSLLEAHGETVALVLSDIIMPFMGGQALFQALRARHWKKPFILISGHPIERELDVLLEQGLSCWLKKPLGLEQLAQAVAGALYFTTCKDFSGS
ncbi:MAG: GAF domain-containing protein [Anaerolineae bacterium]|jgi:PAS domain S-box-containing protein|nr:GAF domain-containing protein [Anaerolineae bacterium]